MAKILIRNIRPYVDLYQDRKTGIAWIEDGTAGVGISCHPNISDTGSIRGMRAKGWWDKSDRIVRTHGFYYNIDHLSGSGPDYETVRATCDCGGYHGSGRAVGGGKKRHSYKLVSARKGKVLDCVKAASFGTARRKFRAEGHNAPKTKTAVVRYGGKKRHAGVGKLAAEVAGMLK